VNAFPVGETTATLPSVVANSADREKSSEILFNLFSLMVISLVSFFLLI
jgi:hypothetical protein